MKRHMRRRLATTIVHGAGQKWPTSDATASLVTPIFPSATFRQRSVEDSAEIIGRGGATFLQGEENEHYIYSRGGKPHRKRA